MIYSSFISTFLTIFSLTLYVNCCSIIDESPTIQTEIGKLTGLTVQHGRFHVHQYLGVPYAKPPVNELRFQKTQSLPMTPDFEFETKTFAPTCIQFKHRREAINELLNVDEGNSMSEDCLYLNIYVPVTNLSMTSSLPVMVWLPGEGFDFADARQFDGSYLASTANAIVITVQYRVGVFGFLKYANIAKGNMGLWDQVTALRWIKNNIKSFGGNDELITVFGRFTGSMSLSLLLTAPELVDENLYKRAILMSGVAIDSWVFEHEHKQKTNKLIKQLNCENQAEKCLLNEKPETILREAGYGWKPVIDNKLVSEEPFSSLKRGQFSHSVSDVLLGKNSNEGTLCLLPHFIGQTDYFKRFVNDEMTAEDYFHLTKSDLKMYLGRKFNEKHFHYENMIMRIFNEKAIKSIEEKYLRFCSLLLVNEPMKYFSNLLTNEAWVSTFTYTLKYRPTFSKIFDFSNIFKGSMHGDDVLLLFAPSNTTIEFNENDLNVSRMFIKTLSNFITNGILEDNHEHQEQLQDDKMQQNLILSQVTMKKKFTVRLTKMTNSTSTITLPRHSCSYSRSAERLFTVLQLNLQSRMNHIFAA